MFIRHRVLQRFERARPPELKGRAHRVTDRQSQQTPPEPFDAFHNNLQLALDELRSSRLKRGTSPRSRQVRDQSEINPDHFTLPKKFDPNEYLRGSFSVFKGGDDYEVVIDFDTWAADLIRGRRWHHSQQLTELPGGQIRLRLRLNSIEEAERWVLSWGAHATVVRPRALAALICQTATELQARYQDA